VHHTSIRLGWRTVHDDIALMPNNSLNRTFCGMRLLGYISFSPNSHMPQNAG